MSAPTWDDIKAAHPDWIDCLIFTDDGTIHVSSTEVKAEEVQEYLSLFKEYDETVTKGLTFNGIHYHVHRFYEGLIYGRADPGTKKTDGFCLLKTQRSEGKKALNILFTYDLPAVSARLIPAANKYIDTIKESFA
jgi:hypothetical protein